MMVHYGNEPKLQLSTEGDCQKVWHKPIID